MRQLMPGDWHDASLADTCAFIARLTAYEARQKVEEYAAELAMLQRARVMPLTAMPGCALVEVEGELSDSSCVCLSVLMGPGGYFELLDWSNRPVSNAFRRFAKWPLSPEQITEYVLLYCNALSNDGGRFRAITSLADVDLPEAVDPAVLAAFSEAIRPPKATCDGGRIQVETNVIYAGGLYRSRFRMFPSGQISMETDDRLVDAGVRLEALQGRFRVVLHHAARPAIKMVDMEDIE